MLILALIGKILKMFLELLALVLQKTGLAASAIFAILFLIPSLIWWRPLYEAWDTILLILLLGSIALFIITWGVRFYKKDKKDRENERSKIKKREVKRTSNDEDEDEIEEMERSAKRQRTKIIREEDIEYIPTYRERARYNYDDDYSDLDRKYNLEGSSNRPNYSSGKYLGSDEPQHLDGSGEVSVRNDNSEEAMIFRTRIDEDILIYEYSDRLEFYRETQSGRLELVEIRRK